MDANSQSVSRREAAAEFLRGSQEEVEETNNEEFVEEIEETEEPEEAATPEGDDEPEAELEEEEQTEGEEGDEPEEDAEGKEESEEEPEVEGEDEPEAEDEPEIPQEVEEQSSAWQTLADAVNATPYVLPEEPAAAVIELSARITDAHLLYDIVNGDADPSVLFDRLAANPQAGPEVAKGVLLRFLQYAQAQGLIEGGEDPELLNDPVAQENKRLRAELARRAHSEVQVNANAKKLELFNAAKAELEKLAEAKGYDQWTLDNVLIPAMTRGVNGNQIILNRISRGNFVDIQRIFTEASNRLVAAKVKKNNSKVAARKIRDKKIPKHVAGETKAKNPAAPQKHDLSTREGRLAAAKDALRG